MTVLEEKLLLKDLCARVPYGVIMQDKYNEKFILRGVNVEFGVFIVEDCKASRYKEGFVLSYKPYLRPMSSMTEEEADYIWNEFDAYKDGDIDVPTLKKRAEIHNIVGLTDFLDAHHLDYRGLIPKGLALEAPKEMYNF